MDCYGAVGTLAGWQAEASEDSLEIHAYDDPERQEVRLFDGAIRYPLWAAGQLQGHSPRDAPRRRSLVCCETNGRRGPVAHLTPGGWAASAFAARW